MVGDESLIGGGYVDDVLVVVGLLLDADDDAGDFLGKIVLDELVNNAHCCVL
jgi:hypothetical protein